MKHAKQVAGFFQSHSTYASQKINAILSAAFSVFGQMFSMIFALVIAFTVVSQKERLAEQAKTALYAFAPPARADTSIAYARKITRIFSNFISEQVLEWSFRPCEAVCLPPSGGIFSFGFIKRPCGEKGLSATRT